MDATSESLPSHLEPLLQPTPSGVAKLLAAWDALLAETQIDILNRLPKLRFPAYLDRKIRARALESPIPYIRYLAYRDTYLRRDDEEDIRVKARLEADPDSLVRFSTKEEKWGISDRELNNPENFLALPHEARLAKVRILEGSGEDIAKIISYALDHHYKDGRVSERELHEILADYLCKPSFREHLEGNKWRERYDGYGEYSAGKENEALWRLIPMCPPMLGYLLVDTLPTKAGMSDGIPEDVLNALTDKQLQTLLYRSDVGLVDLRQKLFKSCGQERESVKAAAICHHFSVKNEDFGEIIKYPEKEKVRTLKELAFAADLRLCVYEAVQDHLTNSGDYEYAGFAEQAKERKLVNLKSGWQRDDELRQLRLYHLARRAVPVRADGYSSPPHGELAWLEEQVVQGDTWATFAAFDTKWRSLRDAEKRHLEKALPRLDGIDPEIDEDEEAAAEIAKETESNFSEQLLARVDEQMDQMRSALHLMVDALNKSQTTLEEKIEKLGDRQSTLSTTREIESEESREVASSTAGWVGVPAWYWRGLFFLIVGRVVVQGWLIALTWGWFLSPAIGIRQITFVEGAGLSLLISAFTVGKYLRPLKSDVGASTLDDEAARDVMLQNAMHFILWPLLVLSLGWLWHRYLA